MSFLAGFSVAFFDICTHCVQLHNLLQALKAKKATPITGADVGKQLWHGDVIWQPSRVWSVLVAYHNIWFRFCRLEEGMAHRAAVEQLVQGRQRSSRCALALILELCPKALVHYCSQLLSSDKHDISFQTVLHFCILGHQVVYPVLLGSITLEPITSLVT